MEQQMISVIKLYGIRRTGTNYLEWLIKKNLKTDMLIIRGKHTPPSKRLMKWKEDSVRLKDRALEKALKYIEQEIAPNQDLPDYVKKVILDNNLKYIMVFKNPYSWYLSYVNHIRSLTSKSNPFPVKKNFIDRWNGKYRSMLYFQKENPDSVVMVCFEDLLENYVDILDKIKEKFNLQSEEEYKCSNSVVLPGPKIAEKRFDVDYYKNREYLDRLGKQGVSEISAHVKKWIMKALDYEIM